jgi:hypothetical protein
MILMIALQRQADSRATFLEDAQMRVGKTKSRQPRDLKTMGKQ